MAESKSESSKMDLSPDSSTTSLQSRTTNFEQAVWIKLIDW